MREHLEDTLDWLAAQCGFAARSRPPRAVRAAVRALGSEHVPARQKAEALLRANRHHALPLLYAVAAAQTPPLRAVRAAMLLHRLQEKEGAELLRRMAREPHLRDGDSSILLSHAVREAVGADLYLRQATSALALLEQRPESFRALSRFRQAMEILRFLHTPPAPDFLRRALVVRTVGGENLSLVRAALAESPGVHLEHASLVRKEAVTTVLRLDDRDRAFALLAESVRHPNPAVQLTAIYGLERLEDPRAVGLLLPLARDPDSPIYADARRVIGLLRYEAPDVFTLLRPALPETPDIELLRPAAHRRDDAPESLLRPTLARESHETPLRQLPG